MCISPFELFLDFVILIIFQEYQPLEIKPCTYDQYIINAENTHGERTASPVSGAEETGFSHAEE